MEEKPSPAPGRFRRLRRFLLALVALEVAYVAAFEWAARTGRLERWANFRPYRWAVSFESAHSWFPFHGTASGLEIRARTPALLVGCRIDRVSGWISPLPLVRRRIRLLSARAEGIELAVRFAEPAPGRESPVEEAELPEIDPLPPVPPDAPPPRQRWSIELPAFEARRLREAWLDRFRFRGEVRVAGALRLRPGRDLAIESAAAEIDDGAVAVGPETIAGRLRGRLEISLDGYDLAKKEPLAALELASAEGRIEAEVRSEAARRTLLPVLAGFELDPDPLRLTADVAVDGGRLRPGTRVAFEQAGFRARMFAVRCRGDLAGLVEVVGEGDDERAELTAGIREFEIRRGDAVEAEIVGSELAIRSTLRELRLLALPGAAVATVDLGEARLPNLATFSDTFPPTLDLRLEGGSGSVTGRFEVALLTRAMRGSLDSTLEGVKVRYGDLDLGGRTRLALQLASEDLATGSFDLSGTRIDLSEFQSGRLAAETPDAESGWWASIELPEATIGLAPPVQASGRLGVKLRDSVPIVGLFETRRDLPRWIERLMTVKDLAATAAFAYDDRDFSLLDFDTVFRKARIRAKARFGTEHRAGAMLVEWRRLALGLRFDDRRKKFKFVGVRPWYASQSIDAAEPPRADDPLEIYSPEALAGVEFDGAGVHTVALGEDSAEEDSGPAAAESRIVPDRFAIGDLDGDARPEAALLLRGDDPESALFLAVAADDRGRPVGRALFTLGEAEPPARMEIANGELALAWPAPPPSLPDASATEESPSEPAAPAPPAERVRRFRLTKGELVEIPSPPLPTAST